MSPFGYVLWTWFVTSVRPQQNGEADRWVYATVLGIGRQHLSAVFEEGGTPFTVTIPADASEEALDLIALALAQSELSTEVVAPVVPVTFDLYGQACIDVRQVAQDWSVQKSDTPSAVYEALFGDGTTCILSRGQR